MFGEHNKEIKSHTHTRVRKTPRGILLLLCDNDIRHICISCLRAVNIQKNEEEEKPEDKIKKKKNRRKHAGRKISFRTLYTTL